MEYWNTETHGDDLITPSPDKDMSIVYLEWFYTHAMMFVHTFATFIKY